MLSKIQQTPVYRGGGGGGGSGRRWKRQRRKRWRSTKYYSVFYR